MADAWILAIVGALWGAIVILIGVAWHQQGRRVDEMKADVAKEIGTLEVKLGQRVTIPFCDLKHRQQGETMTRIEKKVDTTSDVVQEIKVGLAKAGLLGDQPKGG